MTGVCVLCAFPQICDSEAANALEQNQKRFIKEVEASAIVSELHHLNIIDEGDMIGIKKVDYSTEQNEHLHRVLMKKCTVESLKSVCDVMAKVNGNPKMNAFGKFLKKSLDPALGMHAFWWCVCVCVI